MRALTLLCVALVACESDVEPFLDASETPDAASDAAVPEAGPDGAPDAAPGFVAHPDSEVVEPGVRREVMWVDGVVPPPNPVTREATPADLNRTRVIRYRVEPAAPARAIVLAMPGFLAGAGSYDPLARQLVKRGGADFPIEVWAIDRRANQLEELRGLNTAELRGDAALARAWYAGETDIGGNHFVGILEQSELGYLSEWGVAVHAGDLRAVVERVPAALRQGHLFLMGHSLGATFAEVYAGWRFEDGRRGAEDLAGLILIDGAPPEEPLSEESWREGGAGTGLLRRPGLNDTRSVRGRFNEIPALGVSAFIAAEVLALQVLEKVSSFELTQADRVLFGFLLSLAADDLPKMTPRAALGFAFDDRYNPLAFARAKLGAPKGAVETYENAIAGEDLQRPSNPSATYDWTDHDRSRPREYTDLDAFARAITGGPTNFFEWYFPNRLGLDLMAAGGASVPEDGWAAGEGIRAFDGPLNDAPILAIAADIVSVEQMGSIGTRVAPTVGGDRPGAGATRQQAAGLEVVDATALSHVDVTVAVDGAGNPVPGAIEAFLRRSTADGAVSVP